MKKISIIALLTVLTATPATAASINLDMFGNLAAALLDALDGDIINMTAGTTVSVGLLVPISIGLQIQSSDYAIRGTLDFNSLSGLRLDGGIGVNSVFTSITFSGKPGINYVLTNSQTLHLDNVEFLNTTGIYNTGDLIITDSIFTGNSGANSSNAIWSGVNGNVTITGTTFTSNGKTDAGSGGAIYMSSSTGTLTINGGTTFTGNSSLNGGAVYTMADTILNTDAGDIIFDGNTASEGGALVGGATTTLVSTTGSDLIFKNNIATGGVIPVGGAILNSLGTMHLDSDAGNITFTNNRVDAPTSGTYGGSGGAIFNYHQTLSISVADGYELTFDGNVAANGGGAIYNGELDGLTVAGTSELTIGDNAVFTDNKANAVGATASLMGGGAIMNYGDATAIIGANSTFTGNTS